MELCKWSKWRPSRWRPFSTLLKVPYIWLQSMIGDMSQDSHLCSSKLTLAGFQLETSREETVENLCETLEERQKPRTLYFQFGSRSASSISL